MNLDWSLRTGLPVQAVKLDCIRDSIAIFCCYLDAAEIRKGRGAGRTPAHLFILTHTYTHTSLAEKTTFCSYFFKKVEFCMDCLGNVQIINELFKIMDLDAQEDLEWGFRDVMSLLHLQTKMLPFGWSRVLKVPALEGMKIPPHFI